MSIYRALIRDNPKPISALEWGNIFNKVNKPCLICGDFNAHHEMWASSKRDHMCVELLEAIENLDFVILNNGSSTRVNLPGHNKSVVDVSFCSPDIVTKLQWNVTSDTLGSDHYPILINYISDTIHETEYLPKYKWNFKKANWSKFCELVDSRICSNPTIRKKNVDEQYDFLINCINVAAEISIPIFSLCRQQKRNSSSLVG